MNRKMSRKRLYEGRIGVEVEGVEEKMLEEEVVEKVVEIEDELEGND